MFFTPPRISKWIRLTAGRLYIQQGRGNESAGPYAQLCPRQNLLPSYSREWPASWSEPELSICAIFRVDAGRIPVEGTVGFKSSLAPARMRNQPTFQLRLYHFPNMSSRSPLISCAECRRTKARCSKDVPCSSCRAKGIAHLCPNGISPSRSDPA